MKEPEVYVSVAVLVETKFEVDFMSHKWEKGTLALGSWLGFLQPRTFLPFSEGQECRVRGRVVLTMKARIVEPDQYIFCTLPVAIKAFPCCAWTFHKLFWLPRFRFLIRRNYLLLAEGKEFVSHFF